MPGVSPSGLRPTLFLAQLSNLLAGNISIVHGVTGSSRTFMGEEEAAADAVRIAQHRLAEGRGHLAFVGHVAGQGHAAPVAVFSRNVIGDSLRTLGVQIGDNDVRAFGRQSIGDGAADAGGAAGYQSDPPG